VVAKKKKSRWKMKLTKETSIVINATRAGIRQQEASSGEPRHQTKIKKRNIAAKGKENPNRIQKSSFSKKKRKEGNQGGDHSVRGAWTRRAQKIKPKEKKKKRR